MMWCVFIRVIVNNLIDGVWDGFLVCVVIFCEYDIFVDGEFIDFIEVIFVLVLFVDIFMYVEDFKCIG